MSHADSPLRSGVEGKASLDRPKRRYEFKTAESARERAEVNRLLFRTFVVEIPRYDDDGTGHYVDRFDQRNLYFIAIHDESVCGTMAVHDGPVFSVASAVSNTSELARLRRPIFEARIFAVDPSHRFGIVFAGLACAIHRYAVSNGYSTILISGLQRRRDLYERMGFRPLGPAVVRGGDWFVPMALDLATLSAQVRKTLNRWSELL